MLTSDPSESTAHLQRTISDLSARNAKLAELLKASRDKLSILQDQLEALAAPPSTYGTFLEFSGGRETAEVFTAGRHMRLRISPNVDKFELVPGVQVRLGEASQVVEVCDISTTGQLATLVELLADNRGLICDHTGEERVVKLAAALTEGVDKLPKAGDTLLVAPRAGYAFEVIPKTEVSTLALEEVPDVTYADIGGLDSQIELIHDAVELPFIQPDLYRAYDLKPPKGVLLYGPPGCGKTLIAKAVANSLAQRIGAGNRSYFINVKGPELLNKYVGETERRIRLIFERARELAEEGRPVIVFFDEMESIFRTRGSGVSSDMETTVVPQLLTELDGVESLSNVIIIGATNREELIDPAILRPGRLDVKIRVERPDKQAARDVFARHLKQNIPTAEPIDSLINNAVDHLYADNPYVELSLIDGSTEILHYRDFVSGAIIANIVDRAKKCAIKDHIAGRHSGVASEHLIAAIDTENHESEDLPNTSNPDDWSRIIGRHGLRVAHARVLGGQR
ncbi:proteasome ATPase [Corynebacterium belfantii]|uniref:AAA ATPase forming ring-shaped complexes n=1 Tax=Corynebacterium belfantii TaxID=2014537 RepID=A0ABS0LB28_9CORY|nr:proteasome ATPase [Corynebacterium belfantii]OWM37989.1 proteasome ATPase [Corynebacterium diphtheriae subsp. lausannense]STC66786.1 ATPase [Corynebacterium diphtheriae]MBG9244670.1 proteasome ATPase [Corynebacterium belfantii]MBG9259369.1 proteasome ATPase [Corynebacterium belfantii]MBG9266063.1 proteasome ATPase [Corynebacterium belfantii]